ncbi:MAG: ABC transporter substrate-binding protein, partial [Solirubrobacterales bacterium]
SVLALVLGLTAAVVVAGCGSSSDETSSDGSTNTSGIASVDDLGGKIVGAQDGTTGETYANDETDAGEVRGFPEGPDALAALQTGQLDAVIIDQPVAVDAIDKQGGFEIVQEITTNELYGYAMSTDSPNLRAAVNGALQELKDDGTLSDLYQQYFKIDPPETVLSGTNDLADPAPDSGGDPELITDGTLTVGTDTPFPPFEIGQPPDISGYDIDVLNAVAEKLGLTPEYTATSFNTIFRDVQSGQFDIAAAASTITPGREKVVDFSDPYYEAQQALVVPAG